MGRKEVSMSRFARIAGWVLSVSWLLASWAPSPAFARKPEDVYAGKIMVMKNRLPERFRSAEDFIGQIKRASIASLWPEKTGEDKGKWRFEYLAFFSRPLDDLEVSLRFYDVTSGQKRFLAESTTYVQHRGERMFGSNMVVGAPEFEPNKKILITMENRGRILATGTLIIRGEGPHYSGRVEFSEEETKQKDPGR
jgi:hypothetical protein